MIDGRILAFALLFLISNTGVAQTVITGRVVGVHDGDTITVLTPEHLTFKIRLSGIDAPEANQDYGAAAKKALSDMVFSKQVRIYPNGRDRYGRMLGDVQCDKKWINQAMVASGMAWVYRQYDHYEALDKAEAKAKAEKTGLWQQPSPVPPWQFRKIEKP